MAIIKQTRRISPLDLNKNVKIGLAFPLDGNNMFGGTDNIDDQLKANLLNLLLTSPVERLNLPNFGIGLKKLLFEPNVNGEALKELIQEKTKLFVPGVSVDNVSISILEHTLLVQINFTYNYSKNNDSMQISFSDNEYR